MSPGLPGTGIGGLFYILSALMMPFNEVACAIARRPSLRSRRVVFVQSMIATGVVITLWVTGLVVGLLIKKPETVNLFQKGSGVAGPVFNVFHFLALFGTLGLLLIVMCGVQFLRVMNAGSLTMRRIPRRAWKLWLLLTVTAVWLLLPAKAISGCREQSMLRKADAAFDAGKRAQAREVYEAVYALDPECSRAVFRLGQLSRAGSEQAIIMFHKYVELEPQDAWGFMALGDALAHAGRVEEALQRYDEASAIAPAERDVWIGRGRILMRYGRADAAVENYEQWAERYPEDPAAWRELGYARQRASRYPEAVNAFEESLLLTDDASTRAGLETASRQSAPRATPYFRRSRDSDGYVVWRSGLRSNAYAFKRLKLGFDASHAEASGDGFSASLDELQGTMVWRPRRTFEVSGMFGRVWLPGDNGPANLHSEAVGRARAHWKSAKSRSRVDVRFTRTPVIATPQLMLDPVVIEEVRSTVGWGLEGPFTATVNARYGLLLHDELDNERAGFGAGVGIDARGWPSLNVHAQRLSYARPARVGYFAPDVVDTYEVGSYFERELLSRVGLFVAWDAGVGMQRVTEFGGAGGHDWGPAFRLWGLLSWRLMDAVDGGVEIEAYQSKVAPEVSSAEDWRYISAEFFLSWAIGV